MVYRVLAIAMAFVGLIVGAGFASGQEVMQYFVAFGSWGIWGAILSGVIMTVSGTAVLQLSSYFQAVEHTSVFRKVSGRWTAFILDWAVIVTLFCTGVVMLAGAGSNLNQQFGIPIPVGATLMLLLILGAGMLDVDKVSKIIGSITPFIIVFIVLASIFAFFHADTSFSSSLHYASAHVDTTLPNWGVSALNYVGFNLMVAVSMAIIIGGDQFIPREAGIAGMLGGLIYGALLLISTLALTNSIRTVEHDDLPMLSLVNSIHPWLGLGMAVVVYGMIFNTGIGMFYALGKRITAGYEAKFRIVFIGITLVGFVLSFVGFKTLVGYVYPALGYIGVLLIVVLCVAWLRGRARIIEESTRRMHILELAKRIRKDKKEPRMDAQNVDGYQADDGYQDELNVRKKLREEISGSNMKHDDIVDVLRSNSPATSAEKSSRTKKSQGKI